MLTRSPEFVTAAGTPPGDRGPEPGEFREMLIAVTDHAAQRYRQRVRGSLDERAEIVTRVARAYAAGRTSRGERGAVLVRDAATRASSSSAVRSATSSS